LAAGHTGSEDFLRSVVLVHGAAAWGSKDLSSRASEVNRPLFLNLLVVLTIRGDALSLILVLKDSSAEFLADSLRIFGLS